MASAYTVIHCDGSTIGNPGPSGAGAIIKYPDGKVDKCKAHLGHKTNNEAELLAAIKALEFIPPASHVTIFSDSQYVVKGAQGIYNIQTNQKLWRRLREAEARHADIVWGWIPREMNGPADALAGKGARRQ